MLAACQARENESAAQLYFSESDLGGAGIDGGKIPSDLYLLSFGKHLHVVTIGKQSAHDRCVSALQGSETCWFLPLAKGPLLSHA